MSFSEFVKTNIFDPLQMTNSFVYSFKNDPIKENQLTGYRLYRGWRHLKIGGTVNDAVVGDKNIYATNEDLLKWINGLNNGKLISKESLDKCTQKEKPDMEEKFLMVLGLELILKERESNLSFWKMEWL